LKPRKNAIRATRRTPNTAPTPMPALAPVDKPVFEGTKGAASVPSSVCFGGRLNVEVDCSNDRLDVELDVRNVLGVVVITTFSEFGIGPAIEGADYVRIVWRIVVEYTLSVTGIV
jgi:hypothetical protein